VNPTHAWIIRGARHGLAARFHKNLCGLQVTWTVNEKATHFATGEEAMAKAREHGLGENQFHPVVVWGANALAVSGCNLAGATIRVGDTVTVEINE
jgi:hypothetical protein